MRKLCVRLTSLSGFQSSVDTPLSFQEDTHHREGSCSNRGAVACMCCCPIQAIIVLLVCMHDPICGQADRREQGTRECKSAKKSTGMWD